MNLVANLAIDIRLTRILTTTCQRCLKIEIVMHENRLAQDVKMG